MIAANDKRIIQTAAQVAVHHPWFVEFLEEWRARELEALAYAKDNVTIQQGRVQSIDELLRFFKHAVDRQRSQA